MVNNYLMTCVHIYIYRERESESIIKAVNLSSLTKDVDKRPRFYELIEHPYIKEVELSSVDVASWYADIVKQEEELKVTQGK